MKNHTRKPKGGERKVLTVLSWSEVQGRLQKEKYDWQLSLSNINYFIIKNVSQA